MAATAETKVSKYIDEVENLKPLSPLNPEQVVEIFKEATSIALMFKTGSFETALGDQGKKSTGSSDFTELISVVGESKRRALKYENTKENKDNTAKTLENSTKLSEKLSENEEDKFVVRKRVLKERNIISSINKESPKSTNTKPQLVKKGHTAAAQTRGSGSVSKLQKFKTNSKTTYQNSVSHFSYFWYFLQSSIHKVYSKNSSSEKKNKKKQHKSLLISRASTQPMLESSHIPL